MSWRLFNKFSAIAAGSFAGGSLFCYLVPNELRFKTVHLARPLNYFKPTTEWDFNWDHRGTTDVVKAGENVSETKRAQSEKSRPTATRHVILIRHGQYNLRGETDVERILSTLGRQQAKRTGERLAELQFPFDEVVISTMTRAQETGNLILEQLSKAQKQDLKVTNEPLIEEGAPIEPVPGIDYWNPDPQDFFVEGARIEAGFRKYIHRASPTQDKDSYSLLVCHGNVIRYFVCRALQFPPEGWLRLNIHHASITWLVIYPNGRVVVRLYGDSGHMSKNQVTLA